MKLPNYIKETKTEMRHVNWPTRKEAIMATALVVVISVVVAYMLGAFDYLFSAGLKALLQF